MRHIAIRHTRTPSWGFVLVSILLAMLLSIMPLPHSVRSAWPDWLNLVVFYWIVVLPAHLGVSFGWLCGLLQDILSFSLLGQHALGKALTATAAALVYQRFSRFNILEKIMIIFLLQISNLALVAWVNQLAHGIPFPALWYQPAFSTAFMWPVVASLLNYFDPNN